MRKVLFLILNLTILSNFDVYSSEKVFKHESYEASEKAENNIHFDMSSTKLGFITTSFKGEVKEFKVLYHHDHNKNTVKNMETSFSVEKMDTDIDARNEKMWETCLDYKKYPTIIVKIMGDVDLKEGIKEYDGEIEVKGKKHKIKVNAEAKMENGKLLINGDCQLSLKSLDIPDPSIIVATVNDEIKIHFKATL